jgi:hypothetical protein
VATSDDADKAVDIDAAETVVMPAITDTQPADPT